MTLIWNSGQSRVDFSGQLTWFSVGRPCPVNTYLIFSLYIASQSSKVVLYWSWWFQHLIFLCPDVSVLSFSPFSEILIHCYSLDLINHYHILLSLRCHYISVFRGDKIWKMLISSLVFSVHSLHMTTFTIMWPPLEAQAIDPSIFSMFSPFLYSYFLSYQFRVHSLCL